MKLKLCGYVEKCSQCGKFTLDLKRYDFGAGYILTCCKGCVC